MLLLIRCTVSQNSLVRVYQYFVCSCSISRFFSFLCFQDQRTVPSSPVFFFCHFQFCFIQSNNSIPEVRIPTCTTYFCAHAQSELMGSSVRTKLVDSVDPGTSSIELLITSSDLIVPAYCFPPRIRYLFPRPRLVYNGSSSQLHFRVCRCKSTIPASTLLCSNDPGTSLY